MVLEEKLIWSLLHCCLQKFGMSAAMKVIFYLQRLVSDGILWDLQVLGGRRTSAHDLQQVLLCNASIAAKGPVRHVWWRPWFCCCWGGGL